MVTSKKITVWSVIRTLFLIFIIVSILYPFLYMISISLSSNHHVIKNDITFYPKGLQFDVYKIILSNNKLFIAYKNTINYTVVGTAISLFFTSIAAYALSKKHRLPFYGFINTLIVASMFFSGGMIPAYLTVVNMLGLYDNIWAVVIPSCIGTSNLIIMRTFFSQFPAEIEESGRIDGLNDIGVLWYLVLPTSTAILATMGLFYAVGQWNAFFTPLIYLKSQDKYPLQIILRQIVLRGQMEETAILYSAGGNIIPEDSVKYATIVVAIAPIIAVYPWLQKYFVKGVMIGSLKG
jgi:putative aldouronate transport system permease protein